MQQEAEANAETDKARKALIEARNHLDSLIYTAEKTVKDAGDKAPEDDKKAVEEAVTVSKELLAKEDADKDALEKQGVDLSEKMQKVGAAMYAAGGPSEAGEPGTEGAPEEVEAHETEGHTDEPVEGEVVDEGGKDK